MKITAFKNYNLTVFSLGLGLIFFGYNAAEQHFTAFYQSFGKGELAFQSLAILYSAIFIGNLIGPGIIRRLGIKRSIILGFATYSALVFGITLKIPNLVYLLSLLLGLGAGIGGIARVEFLRLISPQNKRGEFAGAIESVRTFGGFLGVLSVSFILKVFSISNVFLLLGTVMLFGTFFLLFLNKIGTTESTEESKNFKLMAKMTVTPKVLLLLPSGVSAGFLLGLVLGFVPVLITKNFGIGWVGIITSLFHLTLAIALILAGYLSDIKWKFGLIYASMIISISAVLIILKFTSLPALALVMVLLGLGASLGKGAFTAIMLNTFESKIKEASAVLGNLGLVFGIVPAFLLTNILKTTQLSYLAIAITVLGIVCLCIFQVKYYNRNPTHH